ncbi:MAG: UDP-glucose 4-epimerase GalE [Aquiluna sp.]
MKLLVTGGTGYIGSHVVHAAQAAGHECVVVDNLATGIRERISAEIVEIDIASPEAAKNLSDLMKRQKFDSVIHLAARKQVGESVEIPERYYLDNIGGMANLLLAMRETEHDSLVFSSSAATYGMPDAKQVREDDPATPINPYGQTKLIGEWMVKNAANWGLRGVNLRYFNVAGTGKEGLGDTAALNLIPIAIGQLRRGETPKVFGDDYPTPDGSCIRDYVHVADLAEAHVAAVDYLERSDRPYDTFNVGTGQGASVFEVLDALRTASGQDFEASVAPRRAGDPPRLVANVDRIAETLGFKTSHSLADIVDSAWNL